MAAYEVLKLDNQGQRWKIHFKDENHWLLGVWIPEFNSREEVDYLEKHSYPELFLLLKGRIVLLVSEDGKNIEELELKAGEPVIVYGWHNGYKIGDGEALIVEFDGNTTEFIKI